MTTEFLGGCIELIANHRHPTAFGLEGSQHLRDPVIGPGGIEGMCHIMLTEGGESLIETGIGCPIGYGTLHQPKVSSSVPSKSKMKVL